MPCIVFDYLTSLRCSLWRYATSAKGHGGQMQHKEGESTWGVVGCWLPVEEKPEPQDVDDDH